MPTMTKRVGIDKAQSMKEAFENLELIKNEADQQFEMTVGKHLALIAYHQRGDTITLIHTEVDPALEGMGAGSAIVEKTLHHIEDSHQKLIPRCPFVASYIKRHPEWERVLAS